jgi:hypothetical protein
MAEQVYEILFFLQSRWLGKVFELTYGDAISLFARPNFEAFD